VSALHLQGVTKRYVATGETIDAVKDVTLRVEPGEMVALCGPSGSGKSTLLLLAAGLLVPDAGSVHFGESDITQLSPAEQAMYLRHDVGLVSQTVDLFPGVPAVENAAIKLLADGVPLRDAREKTIPWLERVGLGDRLDHTPEQMSGGERARVALARALVLEPNLILADEPTANLDYQRGLEMVELLEELGRQWEAAVLLVTHDVDAAAIASRVERLRDGSLQAGASASVGS
jgi:putative ABC transport system ATP-binding protein